MKSNKFGLQTSKQVHGRIIKACSLINVFFRKFLILQIYPRDSLNHMHICSESTENGFRNPIPGPLYVTMIIGLSLAMVSLKFQRINNIIKYLLSKAINRVNPISKLLALCVGNPPGTDWFPTHRASNAEPWIMHTVWCVLLCLVNWSILPKSFRITSLPLRQRLPQE